MSALNRNLLTLLVAAVISLGTAGLRAVHVASDAGHRDDSCAPAHPDDCQICKQIEALTGSLSTPAAPPVFHALVCVQDPHAPAVLPAPAAPRALSARPPPSC